MSVNRFQFLATVGFCLGVIVLFIVPRVVCAVDEKVPHKNEKTLTVFYPKTRDAIKKHAVKLLLQAEELNFENVNFELRPELDRVITMFDPDSYELADKVGCGQKVLVADKPRMNSDVVVKICENLPYDREQFDGGFDFQKQFTGSTNIVPFHTTITNDHGTIALVSQFHSTLNEAGYPDAVAISTLVDNNTKQRCVLFLFYYADERLCKDGELRSKLINSKWTVSKDFAFFIFVEPKTEEGSFRPTCQRYLEDFVEERTRSCPQIK